MKRLIVHFLFLLSYPTLSFSQDTSQIIDELTLKMNRIKDYVVKATIKSDIPLIKIFPVKATIYFKQKDKFKIVSKGIAILPKHGFNDISKLLVEKESYMAILSGNDTIQSTPTEIITILPNSDTTDLILAKLWIDSVSDIILKSQITTRSNGTLTTDYKYALQKEFGLPDSMIFTVDVKKFKIPKGMATDINKSHSIDKDKPPVKTGKIYIQFSGYIINKGINDEIFSE